MVSKNKKVKKLIVFCPKCKEKLEIIEGKERHLVCKDCKFKLKLTNNSYKKYNYKWV